MLIVRFRPAAKTQYGVLESGYVVAFSGTPYSGFQRGRRRYPIKQVPLLAPAQPSKIITIGLNYRARAAELGLAVPDEPVLAFKPATALVGPDDPIVYPALSRRVEHEGELAVVIKRRCHHVPLARALTYVLGYTCLNDVTARDVQEEDVQSSRAKGFDTFCPIGPCIATDLDPAAVQVTTYVNGVLRQSGSTKDLIFPVDDLIARVSDVMTLLPGDVIATGTPAGAGPLIPGDHVEVRIEGIGVLRNPVVKL